MYNIYAYTIILPRKFSSICKDVLTINQKYFLKNKLINKCVPHLNVIVKKIQFNTIIICADICVMLKC